MYVQRMYILLLELYESDAPNPLADSFRTTFGDPAFTANVTELEREYITYAVAEESRAKISPNQTFAPAYYDPQKLTATREAGTSHMAIVDKNGDSVSLTTTVNLYWGAQISES